MKKFKKIIKAEFIYSIFFTIIFYCVFLQLANYCFAKTQTITITKEDIINAKPVSPYPVSFNSKDLKAIEIMEKRHFPRVYSELTDKERLKNLEYELLGRTWEFSPQTDRIKTLKLASSNTMLQGTALPPTFSSRKMAKRIKNDSIQLRQRDNVGLIDGFLRLMNPELYEQYRKSADNLYYKYDY